MGDPDEVPIRISVDARHSDFDANDDRWASQKAALFADLGRLDAVESIERVVAPTAGMRGGIGEVVMTLSSMTGAVAAVVGLVRVWMLRDKARNVKVVVQSGERSFVFEGKQVDEAVVRQVVGDLAKW
jgi:hypothetical protein